tara:strand:+ start:273 stop:473 length:201 start_codon:yes stop_codon:yes gene_type:complete
VISLTIAEQEKNVRKSSRLVLASLLRLLKVGIKKVNCSIVFKSNIIPINEVIKLTINNNEFQPEIR